MKASLLFIFVLLVTTSVFSQKKYFTRNGNISFNAGTAVEDIDGVNTTTTSIFDTGSGQIEFAVLVKGFEFKRALMQNAHIKNAFANKLH